MVTRVSVPVIVQRRISVPRRPLNILALAQSGFRHSGMGSDIDKTILGPSGDPHHFNTLHGNPITSAIATFVNEAGPIGFVSGAAYQLQMNRVIDPIRDLLNLQSPKLTHLMSRITLIANRGGILCKFNEKGELDKEVFAAHRMQFGIDPADISALEDVLKGVAKEYWDDFQAHRASFLASYPDFVFREPEIINRDDAQFVLLPMPPAEIGKALQRIASNAPGLWGKYDFLPGGREAIDVNRKGIGKPFSVRLLLRLWNIPEAKSSDDEEYSPILFWGDEFTHESGHTGESVRGNDMYTLEVPNVWGMAVNEDQGTVPSHPQLFKAGSGPEATYRWWKYFGDAAKRVQISLQRLPTLEIPVARTRKMRIPAPINELIKNHFSGSCLALGVSNALTGNLHAEFRASLQTNPSGSAIAHLLAKGIPIIFLTGGDFNEREPRLIPPLRAILTQWDKLDAMQRLLLYACRGAVRARYDSNGKLMADDFEQYKADHQIIPDDLPILMQIVRQLNNEYLKKIGNRDKFLIKPDIINRTKGAQIAIVPLILSERAWMRKRFYELVSSTSLKGTYNIQPGGKALDVNLVGVNKAFCLEDAFKILGIEDQTVPVPYVGGEFYQRIDELGLPEQSLDMSVLRIERVIALAVNEDQSSTGPYGVVTHPRVIPAGSGMEAVTRWLNTINNLLP